MKNVKSTKSVKSVAKKSVKAVVKSNRGRAEFAFVKTVKDLPEGIMTVVYEAVKKVKHGSVQAIASVAVTKFGLKKVTGQNPVTQTHVMLNRLRALKSVKRIASKKAA